MSDNETSFDPRTMSLADFRKFGFRPRPVLDAIHDMCVSCSGTSNEARLCAGSTCPLWPYRLGTNPLRTPRELSDEQRTAIGVRLSNGRGKKTDTPKEAPTIYTVTVGRTSMRVSGHQRNALAIVSRNDTSGWLNLHGKVKNFVVTSGWVRIEDGPVLTDLGSTINTALAKAA